jgi:hypothetical protein
MASEITPSRPLNHCDSAIIAFGEASKYRTLYSGAFFPRGTDSKVNLLGEAPRERSD